VPTRPNLRRPVPRPEPMLNVYYHCPECDYEWDEEHTSACDSQCPECNESNVEAFDWFQHEELVQRKVYPPTP
jgi:predicted Zn-ribbon and HTH transcriptional regulator